jgi:hypothetical protein
MSKSEKGKKGIERAKEVFGKLDPDIFKKIVLDVMQLSKENIMGFDLLPFMSTTSYSAKTRDRFLKKYNINKETFSEIIETLANLLHTILEEEEEDFLRKLENPTLIKKAEDMADFIKNLDQFQEIKSRYLVVKYCKTNYIGEMDWEIDFKNTQKLSGDDRKSVVFPFCVMRFSLQSPPSSLKRVIKTEPENVTVELSLLDVLQLSEAFSDIREKMTRFIVEKRENC